MTLIGFVALSLLASQYYFSEKIAIESTNKTFQLISKNISEHLLKEAKVTRNLLTIRSRDKDLYAPITFNFHHPALDGLIEVLQLSPDLHAVYFTQEDGHYFEVIRMRGRVKMYKVFAAPKETYWTVVNIIDNVQQSTFLDVDSNVILQKRVKKNYDPHSRPWYKEAVKTKEVITTKPYFFSIIEEMGVTYAKRLGGTGVVLALDYTMEQLNTLLVKQQYDEYSEVYIVNKKGEKFASSSFPGKEYASQIQEKQVDDVVLQKLLAADLGNIIKTKKNEKKYFTLLHPLLSQNAYLGVKLDVYTLMKAYRDNIKYAFMIAFLLLLISLPIILSSANTIVKPIKDLIQENTKIQERKFTEVSRIHTNILEFRALSDSLVSLSHSIQDHAKSQEALLDSIVKLIAEAIDKKSPYTGAHCERVPHIAKLLLSEANRSELEAFKDFSLTSKDELRAFEIASWLHDCGKMTTPEYVVDKAVKLETIYNRIHEVRMRFEVLWRDVQIEYLKKEIDASALKNRQEVLRDDFAFIASINLGKEYMSDVEKTRVNTIAKTSWQRHFDNRLGLGRVELNRYRDEKQIFPVEEMLLQDKREQLVPRENFDHALYVKEGFKVEVPKYLYNLGEVYNLCIEKGTLTEEERYKINEHVITSIKMLENIPFPKGMNKIPEYAGTHHETLIGTGYPKQLTRDELSIPSRIMSIADIFEALTASDRPYKKAKTLSESIKIMSKMVEEEHIDKDLFQLFLRSGIYEVYAKQFLKLEQMDEVNMKEYLG